MFGFIYVTYFSSPWQADCLYIQTNFAEVRPLETSDRLQEAATTPSIALNIVYFVPDARKTGGSMAEVSGHIKKLLPHESLIIMEDGRKIKMEDVVDIVQMTECS